MPIPALFSVFSLGDPCAHTGACGPAAGQEGQAAAGVTPVGSQAPPLLAGLAGLLTSRTSLTGSLRGAQLAGTSALAECSLLGV